MRKIVGYIVASSIALAPIPSYAGWKTKLVAGTIAVVGGAAYMAKRKTNLGPPRNWAEIMRSADDLVKVAKHSKAVQDQFKGYSDAFFGIGLAGYSMHMKQVCTQGTYQECVEALNYAYLAVAAYKGQDANVTKSICRLRGAVITSHYIDLKLTLQPTIYELDAGTIRMSEDAEKALREQFNFADAQLGSQYGPVERPGC